MVAIGVRRPRCSAAGLRFLLGALGGPRRYVGGQDYFRSFWAAPAAVRILDEAEVDGVRSRIIGFVRPDLPAWFRLWVGVDDGRVRRMEMLAEGHLMDHA